MISDFKIKNFRLFDEVELHSLSQVNLIVGKNSAGKSALLEAFLLYFSKMSLEVLIDLLNTRQEHWHSSQSSYILSPVRHFFKGHRVSELSEEGFSLISEQGGIEVKTAMYVRGESEFGVTRSLISSDKLESYDPDSLEKYIILLEENSEARMLCSLSDDMRRYSDRYRRKFKSMPISCQYVATRGISDVKASLLWDGISLTDLEKEVLIGIRLIEPNATGVTFVDSGEREHSISRIPLVKISHIEEPVPLKSLGDGMTRIFHMILSLVSAKDGVLIIDEFENSLHWSTQKDVWNIIFQLASRLNIQVFCSTHSRDCISGFERVWADNEESGSFIRVMKDKGIAKIKEYDLELLADSLETDVEVR